MILTINSISHLLVDAVCLATLFGAAKSGLAVTEAVFLYNTWAFSTQCLVGLLTDRTGLSRRLEPFSMLLVSAGFLLPLPLSLKVVLIGLGNSFFHVCGGTVTLEKSEGRAAPLGTFVAPGALGVVIGRLWPQLGTLLSVLLALLAVAVFLAYRRESEPAGTSESASEAPRPARSADILRAQGESIPLPAVCFLTLAVAVRAIGGSAAAFPWNSGAVTACALAFVVFAGKTAGGFVCDRIGPVGSSYLSVVPAALFTAFLAFSMPASLAGQFLLNLSMPITLWLMYRLMPAEPGFAFGLAASALWPGTLLGMLIKLTGPAQKLLIIISFLLGLCAIIYAVGVLKKKGDRT